MYKNDLIKNFLSVKNVADALGLKGPAVSQWPEIVPELQALRIDWITNGAVKYDPVIYDQIRNKNRLGPRKTRKKPAK